MKILAFTFLCLISTSAYGAGLSDGQKRELIKLQNAVITCAAYYGIEEKATINTTPYGKENTASTLNKFLLEKANILEKRIRSEKMRAQAMYIAQTYKMLEKINRDYSNYRQLQPLYENSCAKISKIAQRIR